MKLFLVLIHALEAAMSAVATSKTRKYFLNGIMGDTVTCETGDSGSRKAKKDPVNGESLGPVVPRRLDRLVRTFLAILSRRTTQSMIQIGEEWCKVAEYQFPANFWELAKVRKVFVSKSAAFHAVPYYEYQNEMSEDELMTPAEVDLFFRMFNDSQPDDLKFVTVAPTEAFDEFATIDGFTALVMNEEMMADFAAAGIHSAEAAQIMGINHPLPAEMLYSWRKLDQKGVALWLTSLKW